MSIYQESTPATCINCKGAVENPFQDACDTCWDELYANAPAAWASAFNGEEPYDLLPHPQEDDSVEPDYSAYYNEYFDGAGQVVGSYSHEA